MLKNATKRQRIGWVIFILYLILLAYFMFFSERFGRTDADRGYAYNLIPFKEIMRFINYRRVIGTEAFLINIAGNVAAFMPCGFFLPVISRRSRRRCNAVFFSMCFSLLLETLQLILKVGSFDVDDMILNSLGAALGLFCYRRIQRIRVNRRRKKEAEDEAGRR